ncbi:MAG: ATP-binding protein [Nostocaceae cyanobacterium]|nr:ATP-binding protein [Nostocaceae cyanobacterium]
MSMKSHDWEQERRTLEVLSSLSYRNGELRTYLQEIACGVSQLIHIDWSVVTLCDEGSEKVLASSIDWDDDNTTYSLHGSLTGTVVATGQSLVVPDAKTCSDYGTAPSGYRAYLGVPLRTAQGQVIGTICSFHKQQRQFYPQEVAIAELFAERAATAIDNYYLYQQQCQFNQILEAEVVRRTEQLRTAQAKLVEQERLAAIGEFAAGIVHEIRNPMTTMKMGLNFLKKMDLDEGAKERLFLALEEANRLERLLGEILVYAKPQRLNLEKLEINQFITEILPALSSMPEASGRKIEFQSANNTIELLGDKDKLKQVLINIVRNACEAISAGEVVKLQVDINSKLQQVWIEVKNGGEPIPAEVLSKLTQPFYSTKPSGTGLGLAITKRIVEAHGGEVLIKSSAVEGTTVTVGLPREEN